MDASKKKKKEKRSNEEKKKKEGRKEKKKRKKEKKRRHRKKGQTGYKLKAGCMTAIKWNKRVSAMENLVCFQFVLKLFLL